MPNQRILLDQIQPASGSAGKIIRVSDSADALIFGDSNLIPEYVQTPSDDVPQNMALLYVKAGELGGGLDSNTVLLLHADNNFADSSQFCYTAVATGVSFDISNFKFGGASFNFVDGDWIYFSNTDDNLRLAGAATLTIDMWVKTENGGVVYASNNSGDYLNGMHIWINSDNIYWDVEGLWGLTGEISVTDNVWHHLAFVKDGDNWYMFVDGNLIVSETSSTSIPSNSEIVRIGRLYTDVNGQYGHYIGLIDEYRISNIARWTSNFDVPSEPYSRSYKRTSLLFKRSDNIEYEIRLPLLEDTVINIDSSMSAADINAIIENQPKNLNGHTLTFQFADGVYVLDDTITFSYFYNGTLVIQGNPSEDYNIAHTNQAVTIDTSSASRVAFKLHQIHTKTYVYNFKFVINNDGISGLDAYYCTGFIYVQGNYFKTLSGYSASHYPRGVCACNNSKIYAINNYFDGMYVGLQARYFGTLLSSNSLSTGANIYNALQVYNGGVIFKAGTQPSATVEQTTSITGSAVGLIY